MSLSPAPMTDVVFDLTGESLPTAYHAPLWHALIHHEPSLAQDPRVGILPLRTAASSEHDLLLPKRAKLTLRVPHALVSATLGLAGTNLEVAGCPLKLGTGKARPLQPYSTLHAHLVAGPADEIRFLDNVRSWLAELNIQAQIICGRHGRLAGTDEDIHGFSLVLHDLKPDASLLLQSLGLGAWRHLGCGVFVPYKVISSLE